MTDIHPFSRSDLVELPSDCPLPEPSSVPRPLYGINSNRPRHEIIATYAREHCLTVAQIDALVRRLPDYGLRSQLHASLAALNVVCLATARAQRRGRR